MAILTDVGRQDMRLVLAGCLHAVVAADTISRNIHVIEIGG